MKNHGTDLFLVLVAVLLCASSSFGSILDNSASGSNSARQSLNMWGVYASSSIENVNDTCYIDFDADITQGYLGDYYQFKDMGSNFYTYPSNPQDFEYNAYLSFLVLDYPIYQDIDLSSSSHFSSEELHYGNWSNIRNRGIWVWDDEKEEGYEIITQDLTARFSLKLAPAVVNYANIDMNKLTNTSGDENNNEYQETYLNIYFSGRGSFIGDNAKEYGEQFVPEPTCMLLLGIGALLIHRKKTKK
jgi:hypothetical protein